MQITVDIPDHLAAQARARGLSLDRHVANLLAADFAVSDSELQPASEETLASAKLADLEQFFCEMSKYSDQIPALSEESFSRESVSQDHD